MAGKSKAAKAGAKLPAGLDLIEPESLPEGLRVAVVSARFNSEITEKLLLGAVECLAERGLKPADITVARVPGAVELPLASIKLAATGDYGAVIALGCVIRGDTTHYDYVCDMAAKGVLDASLATGVPVIFGVLTVENLAQARDRAGGKHGNKGRDAAEAALDMAGLLGRIG